MLETISKLFSGSKEEPSTGSSDGQPQVAAAAAPALDPASPEWLSYYAKVAPPEISRWVNPEDGSGSIPYAKLVENLNTLNIPAVPMKAFSPETAEEVASRSASKASGGYVRAASLKQPRGRSVNSAQRSASEAPRELNGAGQLAAQASSGLGARGDSRLRSASIASGVPFSGAAHTPQGPASRLHSDAPSEPALCLPVTSTIRSYVGPVADVRGPITGMRIGELSRPGPNSQVPPNYVEVVNSCHVQPHGVPSTFQLRTEGSMQDGASAGTPAAGISAPVVATTSDALVQVRGAAPASNGPFHKPPPIFLQPVTAQTPTAGAGQEGSESLSATKGVVYKLGQYVWSEEDIKAGTGNKPDSPLDPLVRQICSGAIFPKVLGAEEPADETQAQPAEAQPVQQPAINIEEVIPATALTIEELGIPSIVNFCKSKRADLEKMTDAAVAVREDTENQESLSNKGGKGGLCSVSRLSKGAVVFVELPVITADVSATGLWPSFQNLTDDQKAVLEKLEGSAADLTNTEALTCVLHCKNAGALASAAAFQEFYGKMKLNAHCLSRGRGWALYPRAARVKHSCRPNVTYRNLDGLLVVFALEDIEAGAPLTMSYIDQLYLPTEERRKRVLATKRIFCQCTRCVDTCQKERKILCPECRPVKLRFTEDREAREAAQKQSELAVRVRPMLPPLPEGDDECAASERSASDGQEVLDTERPAQPVLKNSSSFDKSCHSSDYEGGEEGKSYDGCSSDCEASSDGEDELTYRLYSNAKSEKSNETEEVDSEQEESLAGEEQAAGAESADSETARQSSTTASPLSSENEASADSTRDAKQGKKAQGGKPLMSLTSCDTMGSAKLAGVSSEGGECWASSDSEVEQTSSLAGDSEKEADPEREEREREERLRAAGVPMNYCVYMGEDFWHCHTCQKTFRDEDMPSGMERYLVGKYAVLREKFGRPCPEEWNNECGKLVRTVAKVLGTEHWLYAAGQLLLSQLYLGMWMGGLVIEEVFSKAAAHAETFLEFAKRSVPEALSTDAAPLMVALLRILLFNGKGKEFLDWTERRGALTVIRESLGKWDEVYAAFATAYLYVKKEVEQGNEPGLATLHRYAHASQYSLALDAKYYEDIENARRAKIVEAEEAARLKEEEARRRGAERRRRIAQAKQNIAALKAAPPLAAPKIAKDVTMTHPEGIVQQFLKKNAVPGHEEPAARAARLTKRGGADVTTPDWESCATNAELAAHVAYDEAKRLQQLAVEGRYPASLAAHMGKPGSANGTYLPLLMLADPLQARAEQRRQLRETMMLLERERRRRERIAGALRDPNEDDEDALDFEDDESDSGEPLQQEAPETEEKEEGFIYRIPGMHGTAPGEYVTISQLNHTKDGRYPPIPFFKSFFYVDHEARKLGNDQKDMSAVTVIGCGSGGPPPLSYDELKDIEGFKEVYLQKEDEEYRQELQARVNYRLAQKTAEAAAALQASKGKKEAKAVTLFRECMGEPVVAEVKQRFLDGKGLRERERNTTAALLAVTNDAVREMTLHEVETRRRIEQFQEAARQEHQKALQGPALHAVDPEHAGQRTVDGIAFQVGSDEERQAIMANEADNKLRPVVLTAKQEVLYQLEGNEIQQFVGGALSSMSLENGGKAVWDVRPVAEPLQRASDTSGLVEPSEEAHVMEQEAMPKDMSPPSPQDVALKLKPLDFSHIPPPLGGTLPSLDSAFSLSHSQYKLVHRHGLPAAGAGVAGASLEVAPELHFEVARPYGSSLAQSGNFSFQAGTAHLNGTI
ncbi:putative histone lysine methyltransferase, SET [Besnoitia besnoiti]|uniref:Putative histone lysine methyltransferase, SET n=1 Tax=Besnoitia besnoiti TaxID=94643 RepID=A0A2A9M329_BESBE|nr:putative histone lysine methyltransferase, SET [Besnoitia besnoiti]PFH31624.1 putative histone lysine methyltransferase, SET [Besnoitia besnoiti]